MDNKYLLLVDDDTHLLALHSLILSSAGYQLLTAENGLKAMALLQQHPGEIGAIISDVLMPEMDGFELCRNVRECLPNDRIPFIFVSSLETMEEKMAGYTAGGDDFINKPVIPELLLEKVRRLLDAQQKSQQIAQQLSDSISTAMQAMTYSSQIGQVLEFFKQTAHATSLESITAPLFELLSNQGLASSIQFHMPTGITSFGHSGPVSPLESNLLEMVHNEDRFYDFGNRTAVNYPNFTLLIKNMPMENPHQYGLIKDILGSLCEAIDSRIRVILSEDRSKEREAVLQAIQQAVDELSSSLTSIHSMNREAIEEMIGDIDEAMITLGLTEQQEDNIRGIAVKTLGKVESAFALSEKLEDRFLNVQNKMTALLAR